MSLMLRRRGAMAGSVDGKPDNVPDLYLWFDAGALGLLNGDPVASWTDQGPLSVTVSQADLDKQPLYSTNAANGKPAVISDGSDDFLRAPSVEAYTANNGVTFFAVIAPQAPVTSRYVWAIHSSGGGSNQNGMIIGYESGGSGGKVEHFNVPRTDLGPSDVGVYGIYEFLNEGSNGSRYGRLNGALSETGAGANQTWGTDNLTLFASRTGDYGPIGLAELIAYRRGLTPGEAALVRRYLGRKYGIPVT